MKSTNWLLYHTLFVSIFILSLRPSYGFFDWLNIKTPTATPAPPLRSSPKDAELVPKAIFEMTTADEKFLAEAKHLDLSPLDSCHYKVIAQLHSSCSDLSEEELAKLGVLLYNCQAKVEGRRTYPCTEEMTLMECTVDMDPDTWNAYHIVSNRARAVCYSTRQLHFKRRTEGTVNALISTASSQLEAMKVLKAGQEELKELTAASLEKVVTSQNELLLQQEKLQSGQEQLDDSINANLEKLTSEKALIASGHKQVAELIEGITHKMENVSKHMTDQGLELQEGHKAILNDLSEVRTRAQDVYIKMESNLLLFMAYQNQTAQYYESLMNKLHRMNQSLSLVVCIMDQMQNNVEVRLNHIQKFMNWAGISLSAIYTCVLHIGYLMVSALVMTFLQTPAFSRAILLLVVILNAVSQLSSGISLNFKCLTIFLTLTVIGNWMLMKFLKCVAKVKSFKRTCMAPFIQTIQQSNPREQSEDSFCSSTPDRISEIANFKEGLKKLDSESRLPEESSFEKEYSGKDEGLLFEETITGWKTNTRSTVKNLSSSSPALKKRQSLSNAARREAEGRNLKVENATQHNLSSVFDAASESKFYSPNQSMVSNKSVSSLALRKSCQGVTRSGFPCRNKVFGQDFCYIHSSGQSSFMVGLSASPARADNTDTSFSLSHLQIAPYQPN